MDRELTKRARQSLLADLVGIRTKSLVHNKSKQRTGARTMRSWGPARRPSGTAVPDQADSRDRPGEDNATSGSPPLESGFVNTTINGKDSDVNIGNTYSTLKETQNM